MFNVCVQVCNIVSCQRYSLPANRMQAAIFEAEDPDSKKKTLIKIVERNDYNNDQWIKSCGIEICTSLTEVKARILPHPELNYDVSGAKVLVPKSGKWDMQKKKMFDARQVKSWLCLNFSKDVTDDVCRRFCQELQSSCRANGMIFTPNSVIPIHRGAPSQVDTVVKECYSKAMDKLEGNPPDLIIAILPNVDNQIYGCLKCFCETNLGVVSQCCLAKHVISTVEYNKGPHLYLYNITLKLNLKLGGTTTVLDSVISKSIPQLGDKHMIIFGADVTHPTHGQPSSLAVVVASKDLNMNQYACKLSEQEAKTEIIRDLRIMIREHLSEFIEATNKRPDGIIMYRDGVGNTEFDEVLSKELGAIYQACYLIDPKYKPPVTFVVVQKRHHTRLFPSTGNIVPGTVVDSKICQPTEFDFYLHSASVYRGTSRPTHYHVLWDENQFTADTLQNFTYDLCYTYGKCTYSTSLVPPVQYAHLAAYRAKIYKQVNTVAPLPAVQECLKRSMFYC